MKKTLLAVICSPLLAAPGCSRPQASSNAPTLDSSHAPRTESLAIGESATARARYQQVWIRVQKIVAEQLRIDRSRITPASTFQQLGADSLDTVELVMAFEEEFSLEIPDEKAEAMRTIGDCVTYFAAHGQKVSSP